jgi:Domain of unknown function (DUF5668)
MQVNRGLVFWGVALITAGAVALAIQAGAIDGDSARELWRYWPVLLIIVGVAVLAARTPFALVATVVAALLLGGMGGTLVSGVPAGLSLGCSGEPEDSLTESGSFGEEAEVTLELNCGTLDVTTTDGTGWALEAGHATGEAPEVEADGSGLHVRSEGASFAFGDARQAWNLSIPTDPTMALDVDANAASTRLALDGATLTRLEVDANAGEVRLLLGGATVGGMRVDANAGSISIEVDEDTELEGAVGMNAGSLELCAADGIGLAITIPDGNITFSHNLDESGLTRDGDTYRTGGDSAITLDIEGNAGSFTLNPEDGCS